MLQIERVYFQQHRNAWLKECPGKYVLVHDRERVGVYGSFLEGVEAGYDRLGNVPFLVKKVLPPAPHPIPIP